MSSAPWNVSRAPSTERLSRRGTGLRPDRPGDDARGLVLRHQRAHERVLLDHALRLCLTAVALGSFAHSRRVERRRGLDLEADRTRFALRRGRLQALAQRRRAQVLALDAEMP